MSKLSEILNNVLSSIAELSDAELQAEFDTCKNGSVGRAILEGQSFMEGYKQQLKDSKLSEDLNMSTQLDQWDGSGVPPVGTVCEYRLNEHDIWFTCKIVYVLSGSVDCFVAWCKHLNSDQSLTFLSDRYKLQLRKIKTPEQIAAAEKRQQAVNDMIELVAGDSSFNEAMSLLYDGGYRITGMEK